jgi:beta-galactosidase/beta-glucuronidase
VPPREPLPFALPDPSPRWTASPAPSVATVARAGGAYRYLVDGRPQTIRGMGYNPPEAPASRDARRARLERDLGLMAARSVNTLIGWNPAVIDGLTLDVAQHVGLGVALPFDVDFTLDVRDAAVRRAFGADVLAWVERHRAHPAVRMWAIGNEVLQRSVPPAWCGTAPSEGQAAWADAWSSLLVEVADAIHARDPDHPILYREAEDSYAPWLARALAASPADRPWLVYGVNAYTPRLAEILDTWPERGVPTSLLVSEFAPLNAPHGERADQFREIWGVIQARSGYVLGGAVYVWSTDGPEDVDRAFGLVDPDAVPVDDALDAISTLYHADTRNGMAVRSGSLDG